jgi:hypothetical protein
MLVCQVEQSGDNLGIALSYCPKRCSSIAVDNLDLSTVTGFCCEWAADSGRMDEIEGWRANHLVPSLLECFNRFLSVPDPIVSCASGWSCSAKVAIECQFAWPLLLVSQADVHKPPANLVRTGSKNLAQLRQGHVVIPKHIPPSCVIWILCSMPKCLASRITSSGPNERFPQNRPGSGTYPLVMA